MDERYWIVKNCMEALRGEPLLHVCRSELEVKFLRLRTELLKCEAGMLDVAAVTPYQGLNKLVQQFLADSRSQENCQQILQAVNDLVNGVREQAEKPEP